MNKVTKILVTAIAVIIFIVLFGALRYENHSSVVLSFLICFKLREIVGGTRQKLV